MAAAEWIDCSVPLSTGMVHWPDNPPVWIERAADINRGDICNVSALSLGAHTGTHMDAPVHFINTGPGIDSMPLTAGIGPARVIAIQDPREILPGELEPHHIQPGERILFKTLNSIHCWGVDHFVEDFIFITQQAAHYLAERHVLLVGVDYLSVGGYFRDGAATHAALLGAGIWIIEGLNLSAVEPGDVDLICLPLRIRGGDGAPARAIVRPRR